MVTPDLPRAAIALTHAATVLATYKASPQGIEGFVSEYDTLLSSLFRQAWRGDITPGEMAAEHRRILKNLAPGCYYAGMQDGGVDQSEADETDQQTIADWIDEQSSRTLDFAKAARDAGKDKAARDAVKARADLGTLSGFTPRGGTFGTYFGTLKRAGLIVEAANGDVEITQAGLDYLGADVPPQPETTEELMRMWSNALREGERKMLDTLVRVYPEWITRADLGETTGFTHTGGTFGTYLGTLRRNGLIEAEADRVRASPTLFERG